MDNAAPTITLNGVTSKPRVPITMCRMTCGCFPIVDGHLAAGVQVWCPDCDTPTVISDVFQTYRF